MSNELKITLNISDELLAKVMMAMKQGNSMGIPPQVLASLMGGAVVAPKTPTKDKPTVGFKTK
tara:strand:+ start:434 stop:622 length:189 start_codon:yes stop_codon:yes gene_type:complete